MIRLMYGKDGLDMPKVLYTDKCNCEFFTLPESTMEIFKDIELEKKLINNAVMSAIDRPHIDKWVKKNDKIVIIIPDITRKCPTGLILENILPYIEKTKPQEIIIQVANGNHRDITHDEIIGIIGEDIAAEYKVYNHDSDAECDYIGTTSSNNKIFINKRVFNADKIFIIGAVNYHVFAGFSGSRKSILPGVSARESILFNHQLMIGEASINKMADVGVLEKNPVNEDMMEALSLFGTEKIYTFNVVTNVHNEIIAIHAGCPIKAFFKAVKKVEKQYQLRVKKQYDIVITCASGSPSDLNFYQTGKCIELAEFLPKENGCLFTVAECRDGIGENVETYLKWCSLEGDGFMKRFRSDYHNLGIGPYKMYHLRQRGCKIYLVSDYDPKMAKMLNMISVKSAEISDALEKCINRYNDKGIIPDVAIIPYGSHTALMQ